MLKIHPVWRINLLLHCLESFGCIDMVLLMDCVAFAETNFPTCTWEYFLTQILKDRLEAYQMDQVTIPQLPTAAKNPLKDSVEDSMEAEGNEMHDEGAVCV